MKWILLWVLGLLAGLAVVAALAFQFSPWPAALLIRIPFDQGGVALHESMAHYVPSGIAETRDIAYGDGATEVLDVFFREDADDRQPTIVWVHGGAWISGDKDQIANYLRILADHGYTTVGIDYAIAPGATYPGPVRQLDTALAFLLANADAYRIDPQSIIIAGDSAGGHIAAQYANAVTDTDYASMLGITPALNAEHLRAMLLFCGAYNAEIVDLDGSFGWFLRSVLWAYTGDKAFDTNPELASFSVANFVTKAFPPSFITAGNADPLLPQSLDLAEKLAAAGVAVDTLFYPADHTPPLEHEYQFILGGEDGQMALERVVAFLEAMLDDQAQ